VIADTPPQSAQKRRGPGIPVIARDRTHPT